MSFEEVSRQIFQLRAESSAPEAGDDTRAEQTKRLDHPGFRCPDLGGLAVKNNNTREERMLSMLYTGSNRCPIRVKFSVSREPLVIYAKTFVFHKY